MAIFNSKLLVYQRVWPEFGVKFEFCDVGMDTFVVRFAYLLGSGHWRVSPNFTNRYPWRLWVAETEDIHCPPAQRSITDVVDGNRLHFRYVNAQDRLLIVGQQSWCGSSVVIQLVINLMPFLDMFGISDAPSVLQHRTRSLPQMRFIDSSPQAFLLNPMNKPLSGIMPWTHVDCFMIFKYHYI